MSHVPSLIRPLGAALILGASAWGGQALAIPPAPIPDGPYISEVMANTASGQSATDEYIELWNPGPLPVSVEGMRFTDGDSTDTIVPWSMAATGVPAPGMVLDSWIIEPGEGAVILDPDYTTGTKPYAFAHGTVILTVTNASLGNGLSADDPITLYGPGGTTTADVLDTYGTPVGADVPGDRDDDGLDGLPLDPAAGLSAQRLLLPGADEDGNWWVGPPSPGYRPGSGEFHVAQDESQEYTTIYDALGSAGPGATLFVHPGTYSDNLKIYIPIRLVAVEGAEVTKITGTVTVDGAPDTTTIEGFTHTRQITALDTNLNLRECHLTGAAAFFTQAGVEISR